MDVCELAWTSRFVRTVACISSLSFDMDEWHTIYEHTIIHICCWLTVDGHMSIFNLGYIFFFKWISVFIFLSKCLRVRLLLHGVCHFTSRLSAKVAILFSIPNSSLQRCPSYSTPLAACRLSKACQLLFKSPFNRGIIFTTVACRLRFFKTYSNEGS